MMNIYPLAFLYRKLKKYKKIIDKQRKIHYN